MRRLKPTLPSYLLLQNCIVVGLARRVGARATPESCIQKSEFVSSLTDLERASEPRRSPYARAAPRTNGVNDA
jgi:hypothetical protein